jgi:hypothetical protein
MVVPQEAAGRVAVIHVQRVGFGQHAVGEAERTADDDIEAPQIQAFDGVRVERQHQPVPGPGHWHAVEPGRTHIPGGVRLRHAGRIPQRHEHRGVRIDGLDLFEHPLRAAILVERVVDDSNLHGGNLHAACSIGVASNPR